jgi:hypothetical protein
LNIPSELPNKILLLLLITRGITPVSFIRRSQMIVSQALPPNEYHQKSSKTKTQNVNPKQQESNDPIANGNAQAMRIAPSIFP